jgi:ADP-heptose:LPS heptosyltransferase
MDTPGAFVIFGSSQDMETTSGLAVSLKTACPTATVVNLAGTTLRQLMACISLCDILLSVDSAGLHLGIAAGIPTVGILGGWFNGRFAPWGDPSRNRIMTNHLPCFGCNLKCTRAFHECLHSIRPGDVATCCNELLRATYRPLSLFAGREKQRENLNADNIQRR